MNIAYVTVKNASNVHGWSGLDYYISNSLEKQGNQLDYIGDLKIETNAYVCIKQIFYRFFMRKNFDLLREPFVARSLARQVQSRIKPETDIIFSPGSIPIALLNCKKPKVFYTDATFAGLIGFYESYSNFCGETIRNGNYFEKKALETSKLIIYSSDWAAKTAVNYYKIDKSKVHVVPFGANINNDLSLNIISETINKRSSTECHLLFLGVDWKRKGGDMAVKVANTLNERGLKTTLHIAGIKNLQNKKLPEFVVDHGFISKSTVDGRAAINILLATSHFLILPTLADCTPVVYSEANSFGLPCLSNNVGGIGTLIKADINGKTFEVTDDENKYADYIIKVFSVKSRYRELCLSSYNEYTTRLNWEVAGKKITELLKSCL